mmetsp:Transcript_30082/g.94803  ORF Transcript_30082/g.94803 Transcript_30082/m.94803 type:complete len:284 (-) Transcript_30082:111-962(-)
MDAPLATPSVSLGQAALALALPAACIWRLVRKDERAQCARLALWVCTALGTIDLWREVRFGWEALAALRPEHLLPAVCLVSLAVVTIPQHWPILCLWALLYLGGPSIRPALGLAFGRFDGWPLAWAGLCGLLSTLALVGWSRWWVRGDHGAIQKMLAPLLCPLLVVPIAIVNAWGEELEFRVLLLGALLAGPAAEARVWALLADILHASYFAVLHVHGGFPSGLGGGLLVFGWAVFLGLLRWWAEGMMLVFLLHVQADIVIFVLVLIAEKNAVRARGLRKRSS